MKKVFENLKKMNLNSSLMGIYIKRYNTLYLVMVSIIAIFEIIMAIRGVFFFDFTKTKHIIYFSSYLILLIASIFVIWILVIDRKKNKYSLNFLAGVLYFYATILFIWATIISAVDLTGGHHPVVYMTIICILGGVVVINPIYYFSSTLLTATVLLIFNKFLNPNGDPMNSGDYINVIIFIAMSIVVTMRNYYISTSEMEQREYLEKMSYIDSMTGLLNKNSYFREIDKIEEIIKSGDCVFAVVLFDLNCLKETNDKFGHKYGSQLIIEAGKRIQEIFDNGLVYHVSGDEFVVIIYQDLYKLDSQILRFDRELSYTEFEFEDQKLILSVARGYAIYSSVNKLNEAYKESEAKMNKFSDVYEKADSKMYENKKEVKEKYHIVSR